MLELIKRGFQQFIDDIDAGNSNLSEEQQLQIFDFIHKLQSKELSKVESANYLGVCRATFDNYIKRGWIPHGHKRQGINTLFWYQYDLDKYKEKND